MGYCLPLSEEVALGELSSLTATKGGDSISHYPKTWRKVNLYRTIVLGHCLSLSEEVALSELFSLRAIIIRRRGRRSTLSLIIVFHYLKK